MCVVCVLCSVLCNVDASKLVLFPCCSPYCAILMRLNSCCFPCCYRARVQDAAPEGTSLWSAHAAPSGTSLSSAAPKGTTLSVYDARTTVLDAVLRRQAAKGTSVLKRPAAAAAADTGTLVESSTDETAMTVLSPAAADTGTSVESSKDETVMAPAAKKPTLTASTTPSATPPARRQCEWPWTSSPLSKVPHARTK